MNLAQLAQIATEYERVAQWGLAGVFMFWLMWTISPRLKAIERSLDWLATAHLLQTIAQDEARPATRAKARELLSKLESKAKQKDDA